MERFVTSCDQAASFPKNLVHHDVYQHQLNAYLERLDKRELELFSNEENGKFLTAPNSRERLYTSRKLLTYILTYHQVMSSFLDFLFSFGCQEGPRDINFSDFRQDSRLYPSYSRLELPELGRSGIELRMCYNLKSVEPNKYQPDMPWTIRQTAVYHSLDMVTGNAFWVIVKGNKLIKDRIEAATNTSEVNLDALDFQGNPLAASLGTHSIICDWCSESWRWYLSYLEETLREETAYFFAVKVQQPVGVTRSSTGNHLGTPGLRSRSNALSATSPFSNQTQFSFNNFLEVQTIEDRANEIRLMLESNIDILAQLRQHYNEVILSEHCPQDIISGCKPQIKRFEQRISGVISNLQTQQLRTTNLLRLISDRKNLLYAILQFQDIEASKVLALRAQESSQNMELMTKDMHILALKTKSETVSMRIITLVTLFFLPGTFISTVMSTDIVKFQTDSTGHTLKIFYPGALKLFLSMCLPLMVAVFISWYGVYWWIDRNEVEKRQKQLQVDMLKQA
ncbi:hypothetical protein N431DRAFT_538899 [Stipitochalara longipes BDJ]|nr:hypothetical protein N431DRAFT_538899 [Stipitochalara longipes BDJ]